MRELRLWVTKHKITKLTNQETRTITTLSDLEKGLIDCPAFSA